MAENDFLHQVFFFLFKHFYYEDKCIILCYIEATDNKANCYIFLTGSYYLFRPNIIDISSTSTI